MPELPSGTVTFLFTDIEGSTRRWEQQREAMASALARHDEIVREAIEARGGVVFKTVGDAFCAAFADPVAALGAAVAAQRALAAEDWSAFGVGFADLRVRMAVHTGTADARDGDYFGPPANRVARLLAVGHGGQVLLSGAVEALVADGLAPGMALRDLGQHRLKDLGRREHVFQLLDAGLDDRFPALRSLEAVPGNLPTMLSSFVGRREELVALSALLEASRLVSLTGVGGAGKTRLALQAAAEAADRFAEGAWFVDLAPIQAAERVVEAVSAAMGLRDDDPRGPERALADRLAPLQALVVLDNCEHVVDACAHLCSELLGRCPGLRILATSREALRVDGEVTLAVRPMSSPPPTEGAGPLSVERALQHDAVRLFLDRAAAAAPGFEVTGANVAAVGQICRRLDGIPLAIELAAARVRALTPDQIAARLDDRLRLLSGGSRDRLARQQTLRAAIDWSYDLLPDRQRRVLECFSVFAGVMPLDAAEAVCSGDGATGPDVVDALVALVDKSLVVPVERGAELWYGLLETIRAYASEKLKANGDALAVRRRHLEWYASLARQAGIERFGSDADTWLARLSPLTDDLHALCLDALSRPDLAQPALGLVADLWWFWFHSRPRRLLPLLTKARTTCVTPGRIEERARIDYLCGWAHMKLGQPRIAVPLLRSALEGFRVAGDGRFAAWAVQELGTCALVLGDLDGAIDLYRESAGLKRESGDGSDLSVTLANIGEIHRQRGHWPEALTVIEEALAVLQPADRLSGLAAYPLHNLGQVLLRMGDVAGAVRALLEAVDLHSDPLMVPSTVAALAGAAAARGRSDLAARLLGSAEAELARVAEEEGLTLDAADRADWDWHVSRVLSPMDSGQLEAPRAQASRMTSGEALDLARRELAGTGSQTGGQR